MSTNNVHEAVAAWDSQTEQVKSAAALPPGAPERTLAAIPQERARVDAMPLSESDKAQVRKAIDRFEAALREKLPK